MRLAEDVEWDILENEDALTDIGSYLQESRPFLFHGGEGMFGEPAEAGRTVSLPQESTEAGGSVASEVPTEACGSGVVGASPSTQE